MKKEFFILAVVFVVGWFIGLASSNFLPKFLNPLNVFGGPKLYQNNKDDQLRINNLSGEALEIGAKSLKFKTRVNYNGNLLLVEKEAVIDDETPVYSLKAKAAGDYFSQDYNEKLKTLKEALTIAGNKKDMAGGKRIIEQIRVLEQEASEAKNLQIKNLESKLSNLSDDDSQREEVNRQLAELSSNFYYSKISLSDIGVGDFIQVWSDEDMATADKFKAKKIEIRQ